MNAEQEATLLRWIPYARSVANRFARSYRSIDRDELESAATVAVLEAIRRYDGRTPFDGYCKITVKRRLQDCLQRTIGRFGSATRGKRYRDSVLASTIHEDFELKGCEKSHCELSAADWLEVCFAALDDQKRTILRMRLEGHTMREIADAIGTGESKAWYLWSQAATAIADACGVPERSSAVANFAQGRQS